MDIIRIIKKQIDKQTAKRLNVEMENYPISGISSKKDAPSIPNTTPINPTWLRGYYSLPKFDVVTPDEFYNCCIPAKWEVIDGTIVGVSGLDGGINNLFGIQFFTTKTSNLKFSIKSKFGFLGIYRKDEDSHVWTEVFSSREDWNSDVVVTLNQNKWTTLAFTFYTINEGARISFTCDYSGVSKWKELDVNPPDVPEWSAIPITRSEVDPSSARMKLTLHWVKDTSSDFGGNGIYKWAKIDTGLNVSSLPPTNFMTSSFGTTESNNRWFISNQSNILNSGDLVSFNTSAVSTISSIIPVKRNLIQNCMFDSSSYWTITDGVRKSTCYAKFGNYFYNLSTLGVNSNYSLLSTNSFAISTHASLTYRVGFVTDANLMSNRPIGLDGYGGAPSRWTLQSGDAVFTATRISGIPIINVKRRNKSSAVFRTTGTFLYLSVAASYTFSVAASHPSDSNYHISFYNSSGQVYYSPTLYSSPGFGHSGETFTPISSGWAKVRFHLPATTSENNYGTIQFTQLMLGQGYAGTLYEEYLKVNFLNSSSLPCSATPYYRRSVSKRGMLYHEEAALGTLPNENSNLYQIIPKDCKYIRLGYYATISAITTPIFINRNIHFTYLTQEADNVNMSQTTNDKDWVRLSNTGNSISANNDIYLEQFEHLFDKDREASDGSEVTYDDFNIENNTDYAYYLDAYDSSPFKNRSFRSVVASINSGDLTAPKAPSGYNLTGIKGGLEHTWTNPTALDFKRVICYDSPSGNVIFSHSGLPNTNDSYVESNTETTPVTRYLTSRDAYDNESSTVSDSATPLSPDLNFAFGIKWKTANGTLLEPGPSWQRTNSSRIIASFLLYNDYTVATYHYQATSYDTELTAGECDGTIGSSSIAHNKLSCDFWLTCLVGTDKIQSEHVRNSFWWDNYTPVLLEDYVGGIRVFDSNSGGYPGYNSLKWNNAYVDYIVAYPPCYGSGVSKYHILKSKIDCLNKNPLFSYGSTTPDYYIFGKVGVNGDCSVVTGTFYNEPKSLKLRFLENSGPAEAIYIVTTFWAEPGPIKTHIRYMTASIQTTVTLSLNIYEVNESNVLAYSNTDRKGEATFWRYHSLDAQVTEGTVIALQFIVFGGANRDHVFVDEFVAYKDVPLPTIDAVLYANNSNFSYNDTDVSSWSYYMYALRVEDMVGNITEETDRKLIRAVPNYKDKFRNMLNNSSFEKTYKTASGTLRPETWTYYEWSAGATSPVVAIIYTDSINVGNAYNGNNYMSSCHHVERVCQHDINILSFTGNQRNFIYSAYVSKPGNLDLGSSGKGRLTIEGFNKQHYLVKSKTYSFDKSALNPLVWERVWATFYVTVPSITNFSVKFAGYFGLTNFDALQFEEKENAPPTDYYDGLVITADYIQGNLIRANMIESESIYARHLNANIITATYLSAYSVTSKHLNANIITATYLSAYSVTSKHLNANIITATYLSAYSVTSKHLNANIITATYLSAYSVTSNKFNLIDADILTRSEPTRIGLNRVGIDEAPYACSSVWGYDFCIATGSSYSYSQQHYLWTCVIATPGRSAAIGLMPFSSDLYSPSRPVSEFRAISTLRDYRLSPVKICRPYPYTSTKRTMLSVGKGGDNLGTIYTTSSSNQNPLLLKWYSTPQVIATKMRSIEGNLRYNPTLGNMYYGNVKGKKINIIKLTNKGTIVSTFKRTFATNLESMSYDVSSDRICSIYSFEYEPKIHCVMMNSSGNNIVPTLHYDINPYLESLTDSYLQIENISVGRIRNKFIITYKIGYGSRVYSYRVLNHVGEISIGESQNMRLCDDMLSFYSMDLDDGYPSNLLKSFGDNTLFWISPDDTYHRYADVEGNKCTIPGKYLYFSAMPTIVSLENLFNVLSM